MSVTVDVFIRFKGSKPALRRILADDFLIATEQKKYFFLNYIEVGLSHRRDDPGYFEGREFRPYDFILWGTTYVWSAGLGTADDGVHTGFWDGAPLPLRPSDEAEPDGGDRGREHRPATQGALLIAWIRKS
jgi:hypothetical protein